MHTPATTHSDVPLLPMPMPMLLQSAHQQMVVALVHAAQGIQRSDAALLQRAASAMKAYVFHPLTAALQHLDQELQAAGGRGGGGGPASPPGAVQHGSPDRQRQQMASESLWRLQWALKQVQALLNALELYEVYDGDDGLDRLAGAGMAPAPAGPAGLLTGAVEAFLACWQWLGQ